jgi:uncharacterized membrane protein YGL010W
MNVFARAWRRWASRHRSPTNIALHAVGIPAKLGAIPAAILGRWLLVPILFAVGLGLQFLGHYIEGSRSGEELLLRRVFRRG